MRFEMLSKFFGHRIRCFSVIILCILVSACTGYPYFKESIPNGNKVPHPCIKGLYWEGVGHENYKGSGIRNSFGLDFEKNSKVWNTELCNKDSDGDGLTNGQELGDPDCTWTPGTQPKTTENLSHPGICEPFDSPLCGGKPSFVNCEDTGRLECDSIKEPDTFNITVRFPETEVPNKETTYMCITFELPMDKEYHLVATEPVIDNADIMHHTLVYGCEGVNEAPRELMTPVECGGTMDGCRELIAVWSIGGIGTCQNQNAGYLVGANKGLKYAVMQHHWNNPQKVSNYKDSSGMTLHLTPKLRPHNAGFLMTGQFHLEIPPGESQYVASGSCGGSCLSQMMNGTIYVTKVINHMHLLGAAQFTELRRNNSFVMHLAEDKVYDYNTPVSHDHKDPVMIQKGDELKTTCVFSSETKSQVTRFGEATSDEMCLAFFTYYPKENFQSGQCVSWKSLSHCETRQDVIRGCNRRKILNLADPDTVNITMTVNALCVPEECRIECLNYVRELKQQPCFSGDVGDFMRSVMRRTARGQLDLSPLFARLDSCDRELLKETLDEDINAGRTATPLFTTVLLAILCLLRMFWH
ncbi:DBH-like monooxygenase protein 2 isoform X1 [Ruditapes philippinarum]|uniref:DBH-like monooxygenase protein 2 isoform X1 n=1 Tax=Ruditapes philippinarum TaxID=129788 RepID=UPI00295AF889|nr:DBH-like monooxygenase protein 2 isoform X1 [Ruditapes philippinarum]